VIARILGEGQFTLSVDALAVLNQLDEAVEAAVTADDEDAFRSALTALLDAVRTAGVPTPADSLEESDLILPRADATIAEVRALMDDDGLVPD
jgi:hypothetical protein